MDLQPLAREVSKYAPLVGSALLGPAGSVVGTLIASVFGGSATDVADLAKRVNSDPDAQAKLIGMQYSHEEALQLLANKDVQSARDREIDFIAKLGKRDWIIPTLALFITTGFFGCMLCVFLVKLETLDHDVLNVLCGVLGTAWIQIIAFYFGSSHKTQ